MTNNQRTKAKANNTTSTTSNKSNSSPILHIYPYLSNQEQKRDKLQKNLTGQEGGWGYWLRGNIMSIIKLPEGVVINFKVCSSSISSSSNVSSSNNKQHQKHCLSSAVPDSKDIIRVDTHTYDRSYISYNLTYQVPSTDGSNNTSSSSSSLTTCNSISLQMECSVSGKYKEQLRYFITVIDYNDNNDGINDDGGYTGDVFLEIESRYAWFRPGTISTIVNSNISDSTNESTQSSSNVVGFSFQTPGLGITNFTTTTTTTTTTTIVNDIIEVIDDIDITERRRRILLGSKDGDNTLTIPLTKNGQKIGFISSAAAGFDSTTTEVEYKKEEVNDSDVNNIESYIHNMKEKERIRLYGKIGVGDDDEVATSSQQIIQAAVMWTMIYNPIENGPFNPVSRSNNWSWQSRSNAVTDDWTYVIFGTLRYVVMYACLQ
jgi:hypothetical protein